MYGNTILKTECHLGVFYLSLRVVYYIEVPTDTYCPLTLKLVIKSKIGMGFLARYYISNVKVCRMQLE